MTSAIKRQLLERAAKLLGPGGLARRLNMPATMVEAWLGGTATMPDGKLMDLSRLFTSISLEQEPSSAKRDSRMSMDLDHERDDSGDR
jgi:hypothetical protein